MVSPMARVSRRHLLDLGQLDDDGGEFLSVDRELASQRPDRNAAISFEQLSGACDHVEEAAHLACSDANLHQTGESSPLPQIARACAVAQKFIESALSGLLLTHLQRYARVPQTNTLSVAPRGVNWMIFASSIDDGRSRLLMALTFALSLTLTLSPGTAEADDFLFKGKPIHPACIHALVTNFEGDPLPVPLVVSLAGCMASSRAAAEIRYEGEVIEIEDDALLGDGSFGYRVLSQLTDELFILGIQRVTDEGGRKVSLAVIDIVERPMFRLGAVMQVPSLELLALVPVPKSQSMNFRRSGNLIQIKVGTGPNAMDRTVDLTPLVKARKKR